MAENVTLAPLANLSNDGTAIATINANNTLIENAFEDCLSLSGIIPNAMQSNLDMNNYNIINLPAPSTIHSPARLSDVTIPVAVPSNILSGNNVFTGTNSFNGVSQFQNYLKVVGGSAPSFLDLYTSPPLNGTYISNSGALIGFHPLTYGAQSGIHQVASLYVKSTAIQNSALAEYMVVFDANLNSGSTPSSTGFDAAKVGFYNSAITGSSSADGCWGMANNLEIKSGDVTGRFRIGAEFDITNDAHDFVVGSANNAYNVFVSGLTGAFPITAQVSISPVPNGSLYSAHYGLLINGVHIADAADIEISGGAAIGLSINQLIPGTHSVAAIKDGSTSPTGLWLAGTYTNAIISPGFAVNAGGQVVVCSASVPGSSLLGIGMSTLSPNFGIFFSNVTPTAAVHDGSICLDTTGKLWLRTSGVWTQITVP